MLIEVPGISPEIAEKLAQSPTKANSGTMSWARSAAYGAIPLAILVAAFPALGRTEAEPRPPFDLDRMTEHGAVYVAPSANGGSTELTLDRSLEQAALKILATANPVRGGLVAIDVRTRGF